MEETKEKNKEDLEKKYTLETETEKDNLDDQEKGKIPKRSLLITAFSLLAVFFIFLGAWSFYKWAFPIKGSGNVVEDVREVEDFKEVSLQQKGKIILEKGDKEELLVKGEDNIIERIETKVKGDKLIIKPESNTRRLKETKEIIFYLTIKDVEKISLSGSGEIEGEEINSQDLEIEISGEGEITLEDINVEKLKTKTSGSGQFKLTGTVVDHEIKIDGSGVSDAEELRSEKCEVEIDGSGDVKVNVSKELKVEINGSGRVYYKGKPKDFEQKINGSGEVKQIE